MSCCFQAPSQHRLHDPMLTSVLAHHSASYIRAIEWELRYRYCSQATGDQGTEDKTACCDEVYGGTGFYPDFVDPCSSGECLVRSSASLGNAEWRTSTADGFAASAAWWQQIHDLSAPRAIHAGYILPSHMLSRIRGGPRAVA